MFLQKGLVSSFGTWARVSRMLPGSFLWSIVSLAVAWQAEPASAQSTYTWTGGGANGLWSNAANWVTNGTNPPPTTAQNYVLAGTTRLTGTTGNRTGASLTFAADAGPFVINPAQTVPLTSFTLAGPIANLSSSVQTINTGVSLTGTGGQTLDTGSNGVGVTVFNQFVGGQRLDVIGSGRAVFNATNTNPQMTVASGATISGTGRLNSIDIRSGGTLTPGGTAATSYGTMTLGSVNTSNGSFIVSGGTASTIAMGISGTSRGTTYDSLLVNGTGNQYGGGLLALTFDNSTKYGVGTTFDLFQFPAGSPSGNLGAIQVKGGLYDGLTFSGPTAGVWVSSANADGQYLTFSQLTGDLVVVPEPSTLVFAGIGAAVSGWTIWRRRRGGKARSPMVSSGFII
jgi:hypothetical protein